MLGTLPTHAKKNWQEWIATLTHAYNCTVLSVTGFSPYFLMFGRTPKIPLDVEMGVTLMDPEQKFYQNYAKKLQARLKWAYQKAQENNRKESELQKKYYDQRMRCMSLKPNDLVLVHAKAPSGHHKIVDWWEDTPHHVLSWWDDQPVFKIQPVDVVADENIRVLHRNMLFLTQTVTDLDSVVTNDESEENDGKHVALMKANLLMNIYFGN